MVGDKRNSERSEDVRLARCRALSAALLAKKVEEEEGKARSPSLSAAPPPSPPLPPDLSQRLARCLALSLHDDFHEVVLAACEGATALSGLLVAEALSFSARERALALDAVASSSSSPSLSPSLHLPLPADLLVDALARAAASHRRSAVREAAASALGALAPVASRSSGAIEEKGLPALAVLAASDAFPKVRAVAVAAAGACLRSQRASPWLARRALPVLALALTDGDESVAAAAAAALSLSTAAAGYGGAGGAGGENNDDDAEDDDSQLPLRTTASMEDAEAEGALSKGNAAAAVDLSVFPFARPRALFFPIRGSSSPRSSSSSSSSSSPSSSSSQLEETLSWLVKLALDDVNGLADNAVLSLSVLPPPRPSSSSFSSPYFSRLRSLFCLDSDAAAASSARLLWGLVSLCGGDIEGNARRERYGGRIVRSLLALLRAAAASTPPATFESGYNDEGAAASPSTSPSSSSLLLRSVALAAQAVGAWVPVAAWLGPATTGRGTAEAIESGSKRRGSGGGGEGENTSDDVEEDLDDLGLRCGLLRALLFGLEAASKLEEGGGLGASEEGKGKEENGGRKKRRLLRAGGEVEAVAAVAVAAVVSPFSSSARSVLSLVSALIGASGKGELRKLDLGRRAELWLAVVASEEEEQEEEEARGG